MSDKVKIMIADDHPIFRKGLIAILENNKGLNIIDEAENGEEAITIIENTKPDVAILDVDMPVKSGVDVVKHFAGKNINTKFVFLTMFKLKDLFDEAMDLGVKGYVLKDNASSDIVECIKYILKGELYLSPTVSNFVLQRSNEIKEFSNENPQVSLLTPSEKKVLKLVGDHKTSKEIADELNRSIRTIEHYRASISEKLNIKGKTALVKFAAENKSYL